jgi:predicted DNA-binding ribbon-helix-helix protein
MKSAIVKRSVVIDGHKTSVSLEEPFWTLVREIAEAERLSVSGLLREIDRQRRHANLSSAIRVYVLGTVRARAEAIERHGEPPAPSIGNRPPAPDLRAV